MDDLRLSVARLRDEVVGGDVEVTLLDRTRRRYVHLDSASSTPTFRPVQDKVNAFLRFYSNVGRGTGFKSRLASYAYEAARDAVVRFLKADPAAEAVVFTRNTTESLNRLARLFPFRPDSVVLVSGMEHHSNDLPWRRASRVVHVRTAPDGSLDLDDYAGRLREHRGRVDLVAVTGASNVTGWVNPVHDLAALAHEAGAKIVVDAAQVAPHLPIDMRPADDPGHVDFLAFSGHKTYAPYGASVLAGSRKLLEASQPALVGGGTVDMVTFDSVLWRGLPDREEAGTPAVVGAVALAAAVNLLESLGWEAIRQHEEELSRHALRRLARIPGLRLYGDTTADPSRRLGIFAFKLDGCPDGLVAAVLEHEAGIGARCGWFCAHPYVCALLGLGPAETGGLMRRLAAGEKPALPGVVRVSVGLYNDRSDIDRLCDCLEVVAAGRHGRYEQDPTTGEYHPAGQPPTRFEDSFCL